jgi:hypothetical protein
MRIELDHLFVCTAPGAPEAEKFVDFGLIEGPPNRHPGQGTSCRRFAFANAMIELFWVSDPSEAQNQSTRSTLLWERWAGREQQRFSFRHLPTPDQSERNRRTTFSSLGVPTRLFAGSARHAYW